jgi:hypothetical protein
MRRAEKVHISDLGITNGMKRKEPVVPVFEYPNLRLPEVAPFA